MKGLTFIANASAWTVPAAKPTEFKFGVEYSAADVKAKVLLNPATKVSDLTASYLACSRTVVGSDLTFDLKTNKLSKCDFGLNWNPAGNALVGLKHESAGLTLNKFTLFAHHAASDKQTIGSNFSFDTKSKEMSGNLGLFHRFNADTSAKFKVGHTGLVDALLKHKYNESVNVTFATGFDLNGFVKDAKTEKFPIGIQFDLKI